MHAGWSQVRALSPALRSLPAASLAALMNDTAADERGEARNNAATKTAKKKKTSQRTYLAFERI
jgi:hypothetical protein